MWNETRNMAAASWFLRLALALSFLSAVADRFGLWGKPGTPGVAWGEFDAFLVYTGDMLWYLPATLIPTAGWSATVAEVALAVGLLVGIRLRAFALASALLLCLFGVTMTVAFGFEAAFSYSVWSAAGGAFLLAAVPRAGTGTEPVS